ncbi:MAG: phosphoribosylformylglycinamidine synthase [Oscillospiraceae bacterium]|jgi:phosphoribosylformylglycinamidine synthase|nr:phosphoribosylformylglycinamidine synthase [Oscillospiraceae bacterium]
MRVKRMVERTCVERIYIEKKTAYAVEAAQLLSDAREQLGFESVKSIRILNRYDVEGLSPEEFRRVAPFVFYEPPLDEAYYDMPATDGRVFAWEALPGQFDQRADSAAECIQLITQSERPIVRAARVYILEGEISDAMMGAIERYVINPVDSRAASLERADTLRDNTLEPPPVEVLHGFRDMDMATLERLIERARLALEPADLAYCQSYFKEEERDPTRAELAVLDAYWSDHCRHTTFLTELDNVAIEYPPAKRVWERFIDNRKKIGKAKGKPTLMELATFGPKALELQGSAPRVDASEEVNACSVPITVAADGLATPWLLMFKNETHNHPTEIEPFGGAATCIGGAIRDPLSGRGYVYHAMRVTGAGDPTAPLSSTLPNKIPQRKLTQTAAAGFSSYGNQIGLATGIVREFYHPGYIAKRMELGAVIGAAPLSHVRRERPQPGDAVLLIGGRTGRDGIGGASGSSRAHGMNSLDECGAQVQKGNAPTERKLQRLFKNARAARLIKRCNDFGAGGVAVAIGELADGLAVDLDAVPKKYEGIDGTELAVSESQERMAVVVAQEDAVEMIALANAENLEATHVAAVTEKPRLTMRWRGQTVIDLDRSFLNSNGARRHADASIPHLPRITDIMPAGNLRERFRSVLSDLNVCSQQGLSERFDSTIGAGTVLMPFGGKRQRAPIQTMVAKLPARGETDACSGMAFGFNPYWMERNPFDGAFLAVCESVNKLIAAGFSRADAYLTLQEYFPRLGQNPLRWGLPLAALLGALAAQELLAVAAIGGKDSMSGSFEELDVPPTLVSFAVAAGSVRRVVATDFKRAGAKLALVGADPISEPDAFLATLNWIEGATARGAIESARTLEAGGLAEALFKMAIGGDIGVSLECDQSILFGGRPGETLVALAPGEAPSGIPFIWAGETIPEPAIYAGDERLPLDYLSEPYEARLAGVFPRRAPDEGTDHPKIISYNKPHIIRSIGFGRPTAWIPVFPGTNCEIDTARALETAGANANIMVINNLSPGAITESVERAAQSIRRSQMIIIPGGFSGGDEPDGSAKLILAFFRNPQIADAVGDLIDRRRGLMLGICNGFQALIKLGLVPFGNVRNASESSPALTYNRIGRHQSMLVRTRIASNISPWLSRCSVGDIHTVAISHGEGRFVISPEAFDSLANAGQIAIQYIDPNGSPTMDTRYNPNGSYGSVEAISSLDGRILGKMGHTERSGIGLFKNVDEGAYQPLFEGGVDYFR